MLRRNLLPLKFAVFLCALLLYYPHLNLMAEPELCLTRLSIKFVNGARVYRNLISDSVMIVNIASVDELCFGHAVKYFKKVARDYPDSDPISLKYTVYFNEPKANIAAIREEFAGDPNIEYAFLEYIDTTVYWDPNDILYSKSDVNWPPANGNPTCNGYIPMTWNNAFFEQWYLHNDGAPGIVPGYTPWPEHPAVAGEDINARAGWQYYIDHTGDPIPGDESVIIGHFDTGIEKGIPELEATLWYNPKEDIGDQNQFDPDDWWYLDQGDKGSPTGGWRVGDPQPPGWDGYPGLGGQGDDDNLPDNLADWADPGIIQIISDAQNDDGDNNDWLDEPRVNPLYPGICDCPHTLEGVVDPNDPLGRTFEASHLGIEGYDDDHDGYIDECDGAMWDDDEDGYVDNVIGWDFQDDDNDPRLDPGTGGSRHGTATAGISCADANNSDLIQIPEGFSCPEWDSRQGGPIDFSQVRVGMSGVCPDCKLMELRGASDTEDSYFALRQGAIIHVQATGYPGSDIVIGGPKVYRILTMNRRFKIVPARASSVDGYVNIRRGRGRNEGDARVRFSPPPVLSGRLKPS